MLAADQRVLLHFPYLGLYMSSGYVLSPVLSFLLRFIIQLPCPSSVSTSFIFLTANYILS